MGRRDEDAAWEYLLKTLRPRLALLQETNPPPLAFQAGGVCQAPAYAKYKWGSAIFVADGELNELPLPDEHHGWLVAAQVTLPKEDSFVAVSVHARLIGGHVRPNIDRAFEALEPILAERSFIVGGDFNLSRLYDKANKTSHHGEFFDFLEANGFFNCHPEEEQTYWGSNTKNPYQDDHLFVSEDWRDRVEACDVVSRTGLEHLSDHSALTLDLRAI